MARLTKRIRRYVYYEEVVIEEPERVRPRAPRALGGRVARGAGRLALGAAAALLPLFVARLAGEAGRRALPAPERPTWALSEGPRKR